MAPVASASPPRPHPPTLACRLDRGGARVVFTRLDAAGVLAIGDIAGGFEKISRAMYASTCPLTPFRDWAGRGAQPEFNPPRTLHFKNHTQSTHCVSPPSQLVHPARLQGAGAVAYGYLRGVYVTRGTVGRRATAQCAHLSLAGMGCLSVAVAATVLVRPARSRLWLRWPYDRRSRGRRCKVFMKCCSATLLGPRHRPMAVG